jgi:hypothetical protein
LLRGEISFPYRDSKSINNNTTSEKVEAKAQKKGIKLKSFFSFFPLI